MLAQGTKKPACENAGSVLDMKSEKGGMSFFWIESRGGRWAEIAVVEDSMSACWFGARMVGYEGESFYFVSFGDGKASIRV